MLLYNSHLSLARLAFIGWSLGLNAKRIDDCSARLDLVIASCKISKLVGMHLPSRQTRDFHDPVPVALV